MAFAYSDLLYGSLVDVFGTAGAFEGVGGEDLSIPLIDKTKGVAVALREMEIETFRPAAVVRIADLPAGVLATDLDGKAVTINAVRWVVTSIQVRPTSAGADDGTVYLFLEKPDDV
jgi:hypothetical protein